MRTPSLGPFHRHRSGLLAAAPLLAVQVSPELLWPALVVLGVAAVLAGRVAWRARREPGISGMETLVGRQARVHRRLDERSGQLLLDGSWWTVRSRSAPLHKDQTVVVVAVDGLVLLVEPINHEEGLS